jgi:hypothetical protein
MEAEEHLSALVFSRGGDPAKALALLKKLGQLCDLIPALSKKELAQFKRAEEADGCAFGCRRV